jgi:hypothetical protein
MTSRDDQPGTAVPVADRVEQDRPADPSVVEDADWPGSSTQDVDEADRLEQARPVLSDPDEDYAPDGS